MGIATIAILIVAPLAASAQSDSPQIYIHTFRAPSTGLEVRSGSWGLHGGLYTTILDSRGKSTEFIKVGGAYYYQLSRSPALSRFESYLSASYIRGLNRDYKDKDGAFLESGFLYQLGKGFELRLGTGLLLAKGFKPEVNPTIGLSYKFHLR